MSKKTLCFIIFFRKSTLRAHKNSHYFTSRVIHFTKRCALKFYIGSVSQNWDLNSMPAVNRQPGFRREDSQSIHKIPLATNSLRRGAKPQRFQRGPSAATLKLFLGLFPFSFPFPVPPSHFHQFSSFLSFSKIFTIFSLIFGF